MSLVLWAPHLFADELPLTATPDWVSRYTVERASKPPINQIKNGSYDLLYDQQVMVPESGPATYYYEQAIEILNEEGLEANSQLSIDFDPIYEQLTFHSIEIIRAGEVLDKTRDVRYRVLQREEELEDLIYDGGYTANLIINDVRVNDILRYSYTVHGDNPVFDNRFSYTSSTEWSVPVELQRIRILWNKTNALYIRHLSGSVPVKETSTHVGKEYLIELKKLGAVYSDSETPSWFYQRSKVHFNEYGQWSDVVAWGLPLYASAYNVDVITAQKAERIQLETESKEEQISKALQVVQNEIRYLGLEMGTNSHKPSLATETWERRWGDCKDKTVALISLLTALGFEAYPALVNTRIQQTVAEFGPSATAFNHVLVALRYQGQIYWLDPTRRYQVGMFPDIYQPQYGLALVIEEGVNSLTQMGEKQAVSHQYIEEIFTLSDSRDAPVKFSAMTKYMGRSAESKREQFASDSIQSVQRAHEEFYEYYYPNITTSSNLSFEDHTNENEVIVNEHYEIDNFWEELNEGTRHETTFYFANLYSFLPKPESRNRNSPFAWAHPINVDSIIEVRFAEDHWDFENEDITLENKFFTLKHRVRFDSDSRTLRLEANFQTHTDYIGTEDIEDYIEARSKARDLFSYGIFIDTSGNSSDEVTEEDTEPFWDDLTIYVAAMLGSVALAIIAFILWRSEFVQQEVNTEQIFYPVSITKFVLLTILTAKIYTIYWFYRNWHYVKRIADSQLSPIWRAIFSPFWFIPFALTVRNSAEYKKDIDFLNKPIIILLGLTYFTSAALGFTSEFYLFSLLLCIASMLPLVIQVNRLNMDDTSIIKNNSGFHPRYLLLVPFFIVFVGDPLAMHTKMVPSDRVLAGDELPESHIRFLQRKKILRPSEKIDQFYSASIFDWKADGNGFTEDTVFSYWKEDDELIVESANFDEISKIVSEDKNTWQSDTIINIYRDDGSDFLLYVSKVDRKDKGFIKALMQRWQTSRPPAGESTN